MIFDDVSNMKRYRGIPGMQQVIEFLEAHPVETLTAQRYPIGDTMWCTVSLNDTKAEGKFEVHRRYIDVQMVLEGSERIDWMPLSDQEAPFDFSTEKDIGFFDGKSASELALGIRPGQFAVFFPEDAHKPLLRLEDGKVKKAVFKLPVTD